MESRGLFSTFFLFKVIVSFTLVLQTCGLEDRRSRRFAVWGSTRSDPGDDEMVRENALRALLLRASHNIHRDFDTMPEDPRGLLPNRIHDDQLSDRWRQLDPTYQELQKEFPIRISKKNLCCSLDMYCVDCDDQRKRRSVEG